jgi:hypothetical protein
MPIEFEPKLSLLCVCFAGAVMSWGSFVAFILAESSTSLAA